MTNGLTPKYIWSSQLLRGRVIIIAEFIFLYLIFIELITGTCVQQDIISPGCTVQVVITSTILSMRGAANLVELQTLTDRVTTKTFRRNLTGIEKERYHVPDLVIISQDFIDPPATICIVLNFSNVVNCRLVKVLNKTLINPFNI